MSISAVWKRIAVERALRKRDVVDPFADMFKSLDNLGEVLRRHQTPLPEIVFSITPIYTRMVVK